MMHKMSVTEVDAAASQDERNDAMMAEILAEARAIASAGGITVVRLEVTYPGELWRDSGDALQIDLSGGEPQISTLPPYAEVTL
jgi:hypothetical protein